MNTIRYHIFQLADMYRPYWELMASMYIPAILG